MATTSNFTKDKISVWQGGAIQFTNASTTDSSFEAFFWDFGDNTYSSEENPKHSWALSGIYEVTLTVKTGDGLTESSPQTVVVEDFVPTTGSTLQLLAYDPVNECIIRIPPSPNAGYVLTHTEDGYEWRSRSDVDLKGTITVYNNQDISSLFFGTKVVLWVNTNGINKITVPDAPVLAMTDFGPDFAELTWNDVEGETSYELEWQLESEGWNNLTNPVADAVTYTHNF
jgi:PKD repeat protein